MTLGERMLYYRARNRLSQEKLSELLGENKTTISRVENNTHKPRKVTEVRLQQKMDKLEAKENEL